MTISLQLSDFWHFTTRVIETTAVVAINVWGSRWMSHREHQKTSTQLAAISEQLNGNDRKETG